MGNERNLTAKQDKIFQLIENRIKTDGASPTLSELADALGAKSIRSVTQCIEVLQRKGLITRSRYERRGIRVVPQLESGTESIDVPVFASAGCGSPAVIAERQFNEHAAVPAGLLAGKQDRVFVIRAVGESMVDAGIHDGDLVLVEQTADISSGDVVVAIIDDTAVIKQIAYATNAVILRPVTKDQSYRSIIMQRDFPIFGKVIQTLPHTSQEYRVVPVREEPYQS